MCLSCFGAVKIICTVLDMQVPVTNKRTNKQTNIIITIGTTIDQLVEVNAVGPFDVCEIVDIGMEPAQNRPGQVYIDGHAQPIVDTGFQAIILRFNTVNGLATEGVGVIRRHPLRLATFKIETIALPQRVEYDTAGELTSAES